MMAAPYRENFYRDTDLNKDKIAQIIEEIEKFREPLWKYYKDNKIDDLP